MIANADMVEPYLWLPSNSAQVIAFANHVRGLVDHNATLTLTDDPATVAPAFADDTGDAQILDAEHRHSFHHGPCCDRHPHANLCGSRVASRRRLVQHLDPGN